MKKYHYIIKWRRPEDDNWMYHVPQEKFKNKRELLSHLKKHSETKGVEFIIVQQLSDSKISN